MVANNVRVRLIFEAITKDVAGMDRMNHNLKQVYKSLGATTKAMQKQIAPAAKNALVMEEMRGKFDSFAGVMGMSQKEFKKFNEGGGKFSSMGGRLANTTRKMTHGLRGFRMEMLGVMFFGMGMQKFFTGMLKPALELVGIFDLWRTTLQVLFLPIAMLLLESFILPFLEFILNMSDDTKMMIGKFVLFAIAIAGVMMVVGMFFLGIGSLILALSGLFNIIDKLTPDVSFLGVSISGFIEAALGIAAVTTIWTLFKNITGGILEKFLEMDMVKDLFEKLGIDIDNTLTPFENLKIAISEIINKFTKGMDFKEIFSNLGIDVDGIKDKIITWLDEWKTKLDDMGLDGMVTAVEKLSAVIDENFVDAVTALAEALIPVVNTFADILSYVSKIKQKSEGSRWFGAVSDFSQNFIDFATGQQPTYRPGAGAEKYAKKDDFIWRAGQGAISINKNDNLIGTKDGLGSNGGITYSPTYNINVSDRAEMERMIESNNRTVVNDLSRLIKSPG